MPEKNGFTKKIIVYSKQIEGAQALQALMRQGAPHGEIHCFLEESNLLDHLNYINAGTVDMQPILFDMNVTDKDNSHLAKKIISHYPQIPIVLVANRKSYMHLLFDNQKRKFISPPISYEKVAEALEAVTQKFVDRRKPDIFAIQKRDRTMLVPCEEVLYCESIKRVVRFHTREEIYSAYTKLCVIERAAPNYFIRCHQSYLVNIRHIKQIGKSDIELTNGKTIPISQRRRTEVLNFLKLLNDEKIAIL